MCLKKSIQKKCTPKATRSCFLGGFELAYGSNIKTSTSPEKHSLVFGFMGVTTLPYYTYIINRQPLLQSMPCIITDGIFDQICHFVAVYLIFQAVRIFVLCLFTSSRNLLCWGFSHSLKS